jgi:tetratricopeptide (TPR) repeat protein
MRRLSTAVVFIVMVALVAGCSKSPEEKREAYLTSAQKYQEEGKYAEAVIQYQNALQIAPDDAKTLVSLGEAQLKLSRPQEAFMSFSKASKAEPKNVKAREYIASMLLLAKKYDRAQAEAKAILEIDPKHLIAREVLSQSLFMGGKRSEGIAVMEALIKEPNPTEEMYINIAQMYMAVGMTTDALAMIEKGTALFPKSTRLRFMASDIYASRNDTPAATNGPRRPTRSPGKASRQGWHWPCSMRGTTWTPSIRTSSRRSGKSTRTARSPTCWRPPSSTPRKTWTGP